MKTNQYNSANYWNLYVKKSDLMPGDDCYVGIPTVKNDGVMEIGQYIDMHTVEPNKPKNDYDVRITCSNPNNEPKGWGNLHITCREATIGNGVSTFMMGYDLNTNDSGIATSKVNLSLGCKETVWLKANNFFDGANDICYNRNNGASQIYLSGSYYPKFRWANNYDGHGIPQWTPAFELLTNYPGQQVHMHKQDIVGDTINLNDWLDSGTYCVSNGDWTVHNFPPNSYPWGTMLIFGNHHHGNISQIYLPHSNSHMMQYRTRWVGGDWTGWANVGWSQRNTSTLEEVQCDIDIYKEKIKSLEERIEALEAILNNKE